MLADIEATSLDRPGELHRRIRELNEAEGRSNYPAYRRCCEECVECGGEDCSLSVRPLRALGNVTV